MTTLNDKDTTHAGQAKHFGSTTQQGSLLSHHQEAVGITSEQKQNFQKVPHRTHIFLQRPLWGFRWLLSHLPKKSQLWGANHREEAGGLQRQTLSSIQFSPSAVLERGGEGKGRRGGMEQTMTPFPSAGP